MAEAKAANVLAVNLANKPYKNWSNYKNTNMLHKLLHKERLYLVKFQEKKEQLKQQLKQSKAFSKYGGKDYSLYFRSPPVNATLLRHIAMTVKNDMNKTRLSPAQINQLKSNSAPKPKSFYARKIRKGIEKQFMRAGRDKRTQMIKKLREKLQGKKLGNK